MSIIHIQLITLAIRAGRTLRERELAERYLQWYRSEWENGRLQLPAGAIAILMAE